MQTYANTLYTKFRQRQFRPKAFHLIRHDLKFACMQLLSSDTDRSSDPGDCWTLIARLCEMEESKKRLTQSFKEGLRHHRQGNNIQRLGGFDCRKRGRGGVAAWKSEREAWAPSWEVPARRGGGDRQPQHRGSTMSDRKKDVHQPSTYLATGAVACKRDRRDWEKNGGMYQDMPHASQAELGCCLQLRTPRTSQLLVPRRRIPASLYCNALVLMAFSFCHLPLFYLEMNGDVHRSLLNAERPHGCNIVILAECYPASQRTQYTTPFCWSYQMNCLVTIWY